MSGTVVSGYDTTCWRSTKSPTVGAKTKVAGGDYAG